MHCDDAIVMRPLRLQLSSAVFDVVSAAVCTSSTKQQQMQQQQQLSWYMIMMTAVFALWLFAGQDCEL